MLGVLITTAVFPGPLHLQNWEIHAYQHTVLCTFYTRVYSQPSVYVLKSLRSNASDGNL